MRLMEDYSEAREWMIKAPIYLSPTVAPSAAVKSS